MVVLKYYPGDGSAVHLNVAWIAEEVPRDTCGRCAFCHGDPRGEQSRNSHIWEYLRRNPKVEACPMCVGRVR